jgi:O-methyltransferase
MNQSLYRPLYSPWASPDFDRYYRIAEPKTLVSRDRCYVLERLLRHALTVHGDVMECGVYKGGTAAMLARILRESQSGKTLYLLDTFDGMPETDPAFDLHRKGDFSDTSLRAVQEFVGTDSLCVYKPGIIPDSFAGLEDRTFAFCHIDLDIYRSITDALEFIWPRITPAGVVIFDDYGFPTCPGALRAVDEFFTGKQAFPLCLPTGQAMVIRGGVS